MKSELSGNIIDLCPVGALTSKPFRFRARAWELDQAESIAAHDGIGSNLYVQTLRGKIMRVVPRENEQANETWISDRDRFSYQGLYSDDRLTVPMIKQNNEWMETDWTTALDFAVKKLKTVKDMHGAHDIAAIASPNSTLEEFYLLQKFMRGIGSQHIDHRIHESDTADQNQMPFYPSLGLSISALQEQKIIILIGSHINHEHPLIAHRIRKAYLQGAKILCINPVDFEFAFECEDKMIVSPQKMLEVLSKQDLFAKYLTGVNKISILLGALALNHPEASKIKFYAQQLADKHQATLGYLYEGCNNAGGWIAGCIPHRGAIGDTVQSPGYGVYQAIQAKLKAYILLNIEPDLDLANPEFALDALKATECVIALSAYKSNSLLDCADVILPVALFAENSGTFINLDGQFQSTRAVVSPPGESRPAWKILRVLGNFFQLNHFDYISSESIGDEIRRLFKNKTEHKNFHHHHQKFIEPKSSAVAQYALQRITEWPIYRADALVRRGEALQKSITSEAACIKLNKNTALKYNIDNLEIKLDIKIDERIADDCVWIPAGFDETVLLGNRFDEIKLSAHHD